MMLNPKTRVAVVFCVVLSGAAMAWRLAGRGEHNRPDVIYSEFLASVKAGQVGAVTITAGASASPAAARLKDGQTVHTVLPRDYREALAAMLDKQVSVEIRDVASGWRGLFLNAAPFLVLLGVWVFMLIFRIPIRIGIGAR